jgi:hypothetical protein
MPDDHDDFPWVLVSNFFDDSVNVGLLISERLDLQQVRKRCSGLNRPLKLARVDGSDANVLQHMREPLGLSFTRGRENCIVGVVDFIGMSDDDDCALSQAG